MEIKFYLTTQSFDKNSYLSLFRSLQGMYNDIGLVEEYADENKFYICSDTLNMVVVGGMKLYELSSSSTTPKDVRSAMNLLIPSIMHGNAGFKMSKYDSSTIITSTANNTPEQCVAIMADKNAPLADKEYGPVYNKQTCIDLRYRYWTRYISDKNHYMRQCRKYFKNLHFHPEVDKNIEVIFSECKRQITESLTVLNSVYFPYYQSLGVNKVSQQEQMKYISSLSSIDACPQGADKKKLSAEFTYINDLGRYEAIFCGLHIKYNYDDNNENFNNERRLYFHEPHPNIMNGSKVLIAHIGSHLKQKGFKK